MQVARHSTLLPAFAYLKLPSVISGPSGSGAIRLVRDGATSPYYTSGVVQVWWNGYWGNICEDASFGNDEADVICHQLGWSGASSYTSSQHDSR